MVVPIFGMPRALGFRLGLHAINSGKGGVCDTSVLGSWGRVSGSAAVLLLSP